MNESGDERCSCGYGFHLGTLLPTSFIWGFIPPTICSTLDSQPTSACAPNQNQQFDSCKTSPWPSELFRVCEARRPCSTPTSSRRTQPAARRPKSTRWPCRKCCGETHTSAVGQFEATRRKEVRQGGFDRFHHTWPKTLMGFVGAGKMDPCKPWLESTNPGLTVFMKLTSSKLASK